ncbi:MAG: DUF1223 domain-containing protein [Algibacter sp.]
MQNMFFTIIILVTIFQPVKEERYKPVVVLELFTSQGCSSCPSADVLLSDINRMYADKDVITLSYHVDYWNYIGWKDPFSKKAFSDKQRDYSRKFFSSSIYTPQVVVNGKEHFVGSKKELMTANLKTYLSRFSENEVAISNVEKFKGLIKFDYEINGRTENKKLRIALVIKERETTVNRGENKNRVLKNSNIVVRELYLDLNLRSGTAQISIPELVLKTDDLSIIVLVENKDLDITGGSQMVL